MERSMPPEDVCARCGGPLAGGRCAACEGQGQSRLVQREIAGLIALSAVAVAAFLLTRAVAATNRELGLRDAAAWYEAGHRHLAGGRAEAAVRALRRATAMDRTNRRYRLTLATALAADGQGESARQMLLALHGLAPEDPEVSLRLARSEARRQDVTAAVRYYQSALYGSWGGEDQAAARRSVRVELIYYLLDHEDPSRALSELLALSANLPDEVSWHVEAGRLFLRAGESRRALDQFERALLLDSRHGAARAGAAEAAFNLGDYPRAHRHLLTAPPGEERVKELRSIVALVLTGDPRAPGLPLRQRVRRLQAALTQATSRLNACGTRPAGQEGAGGDLDALRLEAQAFERKVTLRALRVSPELVDLGLDLVYRIERSTVEAETCGPLSPLDRALLLIGRRHEAGRP